MRPIVTICAALLAAGGAAGQGYDLILENARIVDGTGNPWYRGDVGIRGERVAAVGDLRGAAGRRIPLGGRVLAPGFIDLMGGTSLPLLSDSGAGISKLAQGITTMFAGEGDSIAPQTGATLTAEMRKSPLRWQTFTEFFRLLEARGLPLNVVDNVGATQVRRAVIGDQDREPTAAETARMVALVEEAMRQGAVAVSSALIYPPAAYASTAELVALARAAGRFGGFYSTHMRNESYRLLDAVREAIEIGEKAGVPVHIYHLKAAGVENWPLVGKALEAIAAARARGLDVTADIYPYVRNGLPVEALIHPRHFARGAEAFRRSLADPAVRAAIRAEMEAPGEWENWYRHVGRNWDHIGVGQVDEGDRAWEGKSIAEVARMRSQDPWTTFFDLCARYRLHVHPLSMNEDQKHLALRAEFIAVCTDAAPLNPATATGTHPRAFGAFPRILAKYVREDRVIPLEQAVRRMTSLAANRLRLHDRGRIAPGLFADLVVFDPDTIRDTATFEKPVSLPAGIDYVLVNGAVVMDHGQWTKQLPGRQLKPLLRP